MAQWNTEMATAPTGSYRTVASGKDGTRQVHDGVEIIVAGRCGTVTVSRWLPEDGRWNMFTAEVPPIAWMPYVGPRAYVDAKGKTRYAIDLPPHPTMATSWFQDLLAGRRAA